MQAFFKVHLFPFPRGWRCHVTSDREEHALDRYRCRPELSERFGSHWSIYEFQGKIVWTNGPFAFFSGKFVCTNGAESSSKVSPETGPDPWMALPSRKTFQPEFGAYQGFARVLKSPSNPSSNRKEEKILEKDTSTFCAKLWYAPNPGSKEI